MTKPRSSKGTKPTKRSAVRKDSLADWYREDRRGVLALPHRHGPQVRARRSEPAPPWSPRAPRRSTARALRHEFHGASLLLVGSLEGLYRALPRLASPADRSRRDATIATGPLPRAWSPLLSLCCGSLENPRGSSCIGQSKDSSRRADDCTPWRFDPRKVHESIREDAWEFAQLCCGWIPGYIRISQLMKCADEAVSLRFRRVSQGTQLAGNVRRNIEVTNGQVNHVGEVVQVAISGRPVLDDFDNTIQALTDSIG